MTDGRDGSQRGPLTAAADNHLDDKVRTIYKDINIILFGSDLVEQPEKKGLNRYADRCIEAIGQL